MTKKQTKTLKKKKTTVKNNKSSDEKEDANKPVDPISPLSGLPTDIEDFQYDDLIIKLCILYNVKEYTDKDADEEYNDAVSKGASPDELKKLKTKLKGRVTRAKSIKTKYAGLKREIRERNQPIFVYLSIPNPNVFSMNVLFKYALSIGIPKNEIPTMDPYNKFYNCRDNKLTLYVLILNYLVQYNASKNIIISVDISELKRIKSTVVKKQDWEIESTKLLERILKIKESYIYTRLDIRQWFEIATLLDIPKRSAYIGTIEMFLTNMYREKDVNNRILNDRDLIELIEKMVEQSEPISNVIMLREIHGFDYQGELVVNDDVDEDDENNTISKKYDGPGKYTPDGFVLSGKKRGSNNSSSGESDSDDDEANEEYENENIYESSDESSASEDSTSSDEDDLDDSVLAKKIKNAPKRKRINLIETVLKEFSNEVTLSLADTVEDDLPFTYLLNRNESSLSKKPLSSDIDIANSTFTKNSMLVVQYDLKEDEYDESNVRIVDDKNGSVVLIADQNAKIQGQYTYIPKNNTNRARYLSIGKILYHSSSITYEYVDVLLTALKTALSDLEQSMSIIFLDSMCTILSCLTLALGNPMFNIEDNIDKMESVFNNLDELKYIACKLINIPMNEKQEKIADSIDYSNNYSIKKVKRITSVIVYYLYYYKALFNAITEFNKTNPKNPIKQLYTSRPHTIVKIFNIMQILSDSAADVLKGTKETFAFFIRFLVEDTKTINEGIKILIIRLIDDAGYNLIKTNYNIDYNEDIEQSNHFFDDKDEDEEKKYTKNGNNNRLNPDVEYLGYSDIEDSHTPPVKSGDKKHIIPLPEFANATVKRLKSKIRTTSTKPGDFYIPKTPIFKEGLIVYLQRDYNNAFKEKNALTPNNMSLLLNKIKKNGLILIDPNVLTTMYNQVADNFIGYNANNGIDVSTNIKNRAYLYFNVRPYMINYDDLFDDVNKYWVFPVEITMTSKQWVLVFVKFDGDSINFTVIHHNIYSTIVNTLTSIVKNYINYFYYDLKENQQELFFLKKSSKQYKSGKCFSIYYTNTSVNDSCFNIAHCLNNFDPTDDTSVIPLPPGEKENLINILQDEINRLLDEHCKI